jgi:hypothetical protein
MNPRHAWIAERLGRPDKAHRELLKRLLGAQTIDLDRYVAVAVNAHEDPLATPSPEQSCGLRPIRHDILPPLSERLAPVA